jgi:uncharacterized repeat protein (TIGR03803 family)
MKAKRNLIHICLLCAAFLQSATGGAQTLQTLCSFTGGNGQNPCGALTLGNDGNFYGTTQYGGTNNYGTVFKVTTNGTLTSLVSFNGNNGETPLSGLTLGNDGNFYGTTVSGGSGGGGGGTVFKVTTNGTLTTLVSFNGNNGENPFSGLTLGNDGNFYGTTAAIVTSRDWTVFRVTTNGVLTTLATPYSNGGYPYGALTLGNDGNFYGTTPFGGITNSTYRNGMGTVFEVTIGGTFSTLLSFNSYNGVQPKAALTLGTNGNFYGTTTGGGDFGDGTIFMVTPNGQLTTMVSFNGTNGMYPNSNLLLGTNGIFYGTTSGGGDYGYGTVFQLTTNGILTTVVSFNRSIGGPAAVPTLDGVDNFYGSTQTGGSSGDGTVYHLLLPPLIIVQPQNQTNYAGSAAIFTVNVTNLFPVGYQWQKNGANLVDSGNIFGSATNTLTITGISDNDAATYSVIVSNSYGTVTSSSATLTVIDSPGITTQPQNQTIGIGSNVTFSATAYGASPLVFQWYFGNSPVGSPTTGANFSSYTLTNVQTNQSGNYSVQVFNGYDSATSSNAVLTVIVFAPNLTSQPTNQTVLLGRSAFFTVSANGSAPFQYQWRFNSANIPGATNSVYTIPAVVATNTGNYSVTVTNSAGGVISSNAMLTVIVPPVVSFQILAGYPQLNLNGMLSSNFIVQYSTNLAGTNWINLRSISNLSANPYQFLDAAGIVPPARFYRALMQ